MATLNWRTKQKIELEAIDRYEKEHQLGKYAPITDPLKPQSVNEGQAVNEFPDGGQAMLYMTKLQDLASSGIQATDKEETRQNFEQALIILHAASRYFHKAFSI